MSKKLIIVIILIIALALSACQSTPEKVIIINKGDGKLEETIKLTPAPSEQVIDITPWVETYTIQNLICEINPEIIVPKTNMYPVFKVKQRSFEDSFVDRIVKYFTADAKGVRVTSPTKEELEEQLILAKRGTYCEDDNGSWWEPYEGQEEDIKNLEEQIANAVPETFDPVTKDRISLPLSNTYRMADESRLYIKARTQSIFISVYNGGILQPESWLINGGAIPGEPVGTTIKDLKVTEEEAIKQVNTIVSDLGITGFAIAHTEKARVVNGYTAAIVSEGWQITLARNDGDSIPVYLRSNQLSGLLSFREEDFIERWQPEEIDVYIDENGLNSFSWRNPLEVTETLNKNITLQPFEDIKERIKSNMKFGFSQSVTDGWVRGENHVNVNKIILANVLVPIKDDLEHQMLAPTWLVFYDSPEMLGATYVFAVNAIDGSSIDLVIRRHRPES